MLRIAALPLWTSEGWVVESLRTRLASVVCLRLPLRPLVSFLVAVGAGVTAAACVATALGRGLGPDLGALSALVAIVAGVACWRSFRTECPTIALGCFDLLAALALVAYAAWHFSFVIFDDGQWVRTLAAYNYGDLPLHWSYIAHLDRGASFWPETPILTGSRLRYPLGGDLLSALLLQSGLSLEWILRSSGLVFSLCLTAALLYWGRGFAVAAFLFSGGILGLRFFVTGILADANADMAWKNLFLALFLPQRGFLFALPAGLVLLGSWRERFLRPSGQPLPALAEGLLLGALPLFHLHTFALVCVVGVAWAALGPWKRGVLTAAVALLPATWAVWQVTEGFRAAGLVWWKAGWMLGETALPVFLLVNFGAWLVLWGVAVWRALRERSTLEDRATLGSGLVGFALFFFLMLAPWEWDNTKVLLWCFLLTVPAVWSLVLANRRLAVRMVVLGFLLVPQAPCLLASARGVGPRLDIFRRDEVDEVCRAVREIPVSSRVATAQTFNHPVALCGQAIVAGYAGHLWSHGYDAKAVERDLATVLDGGEGWREAAGRVQAEYVFWGARESSEHRRSTRAWLETGVVIRQGPFGMLVKLDRGTGW